MLPRSQPNFNNNNRRFHTPNNALNTQFSQDTAFFQNIVSKPNTNPEETKPSKVPSFTASEVIDDLRHTKARLDLTLLLCVQNFKLEKLPPSEIRQLSVELFPLIKEVSNPKNRHRISKNKAECLYNCLEFLEGSLEREQAEALYPLLLPAFERKKDHAMLALLHVTLGENAQRNLDFDAAASHFQGCLTSAHHAELEKFLLVLPAYNYFLQSSIKTLDSGSDQLDPYSCIKKWSAKILAVLDCPDNKHKDEQADSTALLALSSCAKANAKLEQARRAPQGSTLALYERLVLNASHSEDYLMLPTALVEFARFQKFSGNLEATKNLLDLAHSSIATRYDDAAKSIKLDLRRIYETLEHDDELPGEGSLG